MKKIYQTIHGIPHGNCMQAAVASLLNIEIDDIPNFIDYGDDWLSEIEKVLSEYKCHFVKSPKFYYNDKVHYLMNPAYGCFEKEQEKPKNTLEDALGKNGVDGFFIASVFSPKLFTFKGWEQHCVLVDNALNIVHDPNREYKGIIQYPFKELIGYNGICDIWNIERD
jgi:hypothetical protein